MKYAELKEPCKSLIEKGKCLGCAQLENLNFIGNKNCINIRTEIEQIKINLEKER